MPWATEDGGYSPDKFYTMGGNKDRVFIRGTIPTDVHRQLSRLVQSGQFGSYETQQDFYRDAIFHRIKYLVDNYQMPASMEKVVNLHEAKESLAAAVHLLKDSEGFVIDLEYQLSNMVRTGVNTHDTEFLESIVKGIPALVPPFLQRAIEILSKYYSHDEIPEDIWQMAEDLA